MAEDKPLPVELPAPALKEAQHRVLRVQAANDRFGAPVITRQTNPGMTHFHPLSRSGWRRAMTGMGQLHALRRQRRNGSIVPFPDNPVFTVHNRLGFRERGLLGALWYRAAQSRACEQARGIERRQR